MDDLYDLETRTWPQLKECAATAIPVLRKLAAEGSADAAAALEKVAYILSEHWEGPT
jgi:hypothetical protein